MKRYQCFAGNHGGLAAFSTKTIGETDRREDVAAVLAASGKLNYDCIEVLDLKSARWWSIKNMNIILVEAHRLLLA